MADVENNGAAAAAEPITDAKVLKRKLTEEATDAPAAAADVAGDEKASTDDAPAIKKTKVDTLKQNLTEEATDAPAAVADVASGEKASTNDAAAIKKSKLDEQPSKLESDIIKQIEYYFGDANLFRDKFLQTEIAKDEGWVPLATMLTFKRLAALSTDPNVIVDALNKSDEGLVEISENRERIRRHPERPLPEKNEETRKEIITRTAYVKGFPIDIEMADYIEFFDNYEKVTNIVVRKYLDKPTKLYKPKGSVFVTFATVEQCAEFLKLDKVEFRDAALIKKLQSDYQADKKAEKGKEKEKKVNKNENVQLFLKHFVYLVIIDAN